MNENILEFRNVTKRFGGKPVVDNLSFKVRGGEAFGLLGPNGAGKSSILRMMMNIIQPDFGDILLNGESRSKVKSCRFGYLPENRGLYPRVKVLDMLIYFGTLNNLSRRKAEVEAIRFMDRFGIVEFADSRVNQLSRGVQQKIQFIAISLHDPDVLALDEPFTGLDPINQIVLRDILKDFRDKNKIIVISTHQMEQAEKYCDHICLINQAKVVVDAPLSDVKRWSRENAYFVESDQSLTFLASFPGVKILEENNNACKFSLAGESVMVKDILNEIQQRVKIRKFEVAEPSLYDIFIKLIHEQIKRNDM
jgi:ABC-2 type transport system ATP-binding protein